MTKHFLHRPSTVIAFFLCIGLSFTCCNRDSGPTSTTDTATSEQGAERFDERDDKDNKKGKKDKDKGDSAQAVYLRDLDSTHTGAARIIYNDIQFTLFIADPAQHDIRLHLTDTNGVNFSSIGNLLKTEKDKGRKTLMVMNGGMYTPQGTPQGLYIEDYKKKKDLDLTDPNDLNFYLKPNGVFYIDSTGVHVTQSEKYAAIKHKKVQYATQSGPLLVGNDTIHYRFNSWSPNQHIRNGVGVDSLGRAIFAISDVPVTFYNFSCLFRDGFGCDNALFLDGAISQMYAPPFRTDKGGNFGPMISITDKPKP